MNHDELCVFAQSSEQGRTNKLGRSESSRQLHAELDNAWRMMSRGLFSTPVVVHGQRLLSHRNHSNQSCRIVLYQTTSDCVRSMSRNSLLQFHSVMQHDVKSQSLHIMSCHAWPHRPILSCRATRWQVVCHAERKPHHFMS